MNRKQFDHTIRAAGAILATDQVLVIGSQAIHGSTDIEIPEAERSIEADISALKDEDGTKADLIDGSIGELSIFQETFGYYAQGVTPDTAVLPAGWRNRLVTYESASTNGVKALCLEIHDLWISKVAFNVLINATILCRFLKRYGLYHLLYPTIIRSLHFWRCGHECDRARIEASGQAVGQCARRGRNGAGLRKPGGVSGDRRADGPVSVPRKAVPSGPESEGNAGRCGVTIHTMEFDLMTGR